MAAQRQVLQASSSLGADKLILNDPEKHPSPFQRGRFPKLCPNSRYQRSDILIVTPALGIYMKGTDHLTCGLHQFCVLGQIPISSPPLTPSALLTKALVVVLSVPDPLPKATLCPLPGRPVLPRPLSILLRVPGKQ